MWTRSASQSPVNGVNLTKGLIQLDPYLADVVLGSQHALHSIGGDQRLHHLAVVVLHRRSHPSQPFPKISNCQAQQHAQGGYDLM